jgi:uncharacterized surface protein with fasciclin (FAS1) repeats
MSTSQMTRLGLAGLLLSLTACAPKTDTAPPSDDTAAPADKSDAADSPGDAEDAKDEPADDAKADAKDGEDAKDAPAKSGGGDVLSILAGNPKTRTFAELAALTDFGKGLHGQEGSGFTILAPSDDAFAKLGKGTIERWKKKPAELEGVIRLHVVLGKNDINKLTNFRTAPTAAGKDLEVKTQDNDVTVGGAKLIETDQVGTNGVVHVIDRVLKSK